MKSPTDGARPLTPYSDVGVRLPPELILAEGQKSTRSCQAETEVCLRQNKCRAS